jgi:DNA-binding transcriptional LysR family regulator
MGIGLLPVYALADHVQAGRATRVLPAWQAQGLGNALYILSMPDRHPSHAARVLTEYLREALAALAHA